MMTPFQMIPVVHKVQGQRSTQQTRMFPQHLFKVISEKSLTHVTRNPDAPRWWEIARVTPPVAFDAFIPFLHTNPDKKSADPTLTVPEIWNESRKRWNQIHTRTEKNSERIKHERERRTDTHASNNYVTRQQRMQRYDTTSLHYGQLQTQHYEYYEISELRIYKARCSYTL